MFFSRLVDRLRSFCGMKPVIRCAVCGHKKATQSAGVGRCDSVRTVRPLCGAASCLAQMQKIEKTENITLTPISSSIYVALVR